MYPPVPIVPTPLIDSSLCKEVLTLISTNIVVDNKAGLTVKITIYNFNLI